jgi:hypothetical protein
MKELFSIYDGLYKILGSYSQCINTWCVIKVNDTTEYQGMDCTSLLSANCLLRGLYLLGTKLNIHKHCLLRRASDRCLPITVGLPDYMKIKELYLSGMQTTSNAKQVQMNLKQLRYLWKHLNQSVQLYRQTINRQ